MGFEEFKTRVPRALIVAASGPCVRCGKLSPQRIFVGLGDGGGGRLKNLKLVECELTTCDACREAQTR